MNNELKPCPFCGGELIVNKFPTFVCYDKEEFGEYEVVHKDEWAAIRAKCPMIMIAYDGEESAIEGANNRCVDGNTSDGYHTFNELYHHRTVLFSVIVRNYPELSWKSKKHHTGDMYDGMFIVGIDTPFGQASYHYDIDPYWDMFDCKELEYAPEWDGHTPEQAIERIGKLSAIHRGQPFCDNGFFILPYPQKPIVRQYKAVTTDNKHYLYNDVINIQDYMIQLENYKLGKTLAKALAEAYGFEVKEGEHEHVG